MLIRKAKLENGKDKVVRDVAGALRGSSAGRQERTTGEAIGPVSRVRAGLLSVCPVVSLVSLHGLCREQRTVKDSGPAND